MKKYFTGIISLLILQSLQAQRQPDVPPAQLPKHETGRPVFTDPSFPPLLQYLHPDSWKGNLSWTTAVAGYSATIREMIFPITGGVIWQNSLQEVVPPQPGTCTINGNEINIYFNYSPYRYSFKGTYNKLPGKITGTFTQTRMKMLNTPAGYTPGSISGTFSLTK